MDKPRRPIRRIRNAESVRDTIDDPTSDEFAPLRNSARSLTNESAAAMRAGAQVRDLPVLPVRNTVLLPNMVVPLFIDREPALRAVEEAMNADRSILIVSQRAEDITDPLPQDVYDVGVECVVNRVLRMPDGAGSVLAQAVRRFRIETWLQEAPFGRVRGVAFTEPELRSEQIEALARTALRLFERCVKLSSRLGEDAYIQALNVERPGALADYIVAQLEPPMQTRQEILETFDPAARLRKACYLLQRELNVLELEQSIQEDVQREVDRGQREYYLREQMKVIQKELGEHDPAMRESGELRERIESAGMPAETQARALKELERLEAMPSIAPEYSVLRGYLDWLIALPWNKRSDDRVDLRHVAETLDANHYGLTKVKDRILEFMAVRKLAPEGRTPILCFSGPPGVGKTSLGRSIAEALGRKFVRVSLGGVRDEAEIRGHRRTYVGALPGRIIQAMKTVGVRNPVIILDEIDKLASDYRGDPSSALLEALDPEQNHSFTDHYLETPYDLSEVFFICTGNNRFQIPRALADRMDIIEIPGYTEEEKVAIGRSFLWEKTLDQCGLAPSQAQLSPAVMEFVVTRYTREAGVRNLERSLDGICRKLALRVLQKPDAKAQARLRVTEKMVEEFLGAPRYSPDHPFEPGQVGVAMGLAWTTNGGALLPVEVLTMPGKGGLIVTGQLGDVMQESARAAYSYIRSRADDLHIPNSFPNNLDLHIHLPEGAVPKEGPSAGITMAIAMISALTRRPVRSDVAMTGEITLRGRVLPIGGLKNKALAAYSVGIRNLLAPMENEKDLAEIPPKIRHELNITLVATMDDVIRIALTPAVGADAEPAGPDETRAADASANATDATDMPAQSPNGLPLVASEVSETPTGTATPDDSFAPAPPPDDLGETHDQAPS